MSVHLQLLGRFQVRRDGVEVAPAAFGGRKVRTLLRVLAVGRPNLLRHDVLAEALWPDRCPADPAANLGVLVNRSRRAVGDPRLIITGSGGYALGECSVDMTEFLAAVDRAGAAAGDHAAALRACADALGLWGEPLPEDTYAAWAREPRERLHRARVEACERAGRAALELGDPHAAVSYAADAVASDALNESAALTLARALAAAGDPAGALRCLAELRGRLVDQLGIDPSAEVEQLQVALLRGDVRVVRRAPAPSRAAPRPFSDLTFVGRADEVARLRAAVADGGAAVVAGVAGVGKSRLIAEFVRDWPQPVLAARAFLPERAEAWGLARSLLREALAIDTAIADTLTPRVRDALAVVLPELGDGEAAVIDGESRRALQLAGGLHLLEAAVGEGALLVADDLQWADPSSLALLGSALARIPRLAAILAFRPGELDSGAHTVLREARPAITVDLGPLPAAAIETLLDDGDLTRAVLDATDHTPFAVTEVLRELVARGQLDLSPGGYWTARGPGTVVLATELGREGQRRAVQRRAGRETGVRAELLALLALLAREAPASTLVAATGRDARTVLDALSGLAGSGLLRLGEQGWATAHDLVAETVTSGLGDGERGRLHGLLASALELQHADPSEIARHHREAGDAAAATTTFAAAADAALAAHATHEAADLADAGLALDPRPTVRADLLAARAEARAAHGDPAAGGDLRDALAATPPGPQRSRRLSRLAMITFGAQDAQQAHEVAELALVEAGIDDAAVALALETTAIIDMNLDRPALARDRAEAALVRYRRLGDAAGVARILDGRAMATFLDGRITDGIEVFGRVMQLFTDSGELLRVVTPLSTRGHGMVFAARPEDGLVETTAALRLARDLDAAEGQAYALWHRSEALSALDRLDEAESDAREALAIARRVDHRGWTATAHRAIGIALLARHEVHGAAAAFAASARAAGTSLTLFASWAAAQASLVHVALGQLDDAGDLADRAMAIGPPLGHYEARLARVELLAARDDPTATESATTALALARDGGHEVSAGRLSDLLSRS